MTKIFRYIFLIFFSLVWLVGCSGDFAKFLFEKNIFPDDYRFGDLYRLSNLPQFRVPVQKCEISAKKSTLPVNLIVIGDSFTEAGRLSKDDFQATNYQRFSIGDSSFIKLDKTKKNILVIETVERHFRERFAKPYKNLQTIDNQLVTKQKKPFNLVDYNLPYNAERHESALFSYDFFMKLKEWKALINWYFFDKINEKVSLSKDKKFLLYSLDTNPGINSCFDKIEENEIEKLVENVNLTKEFYQKLGFDEVILSIIPNKTSIYAQELGEYNHLIERIQQNSALKTEFIDAYSPLKNNPKMLYDIGDTHWNCEGKQIWIDKINDILAEKSTLNSAPKKF